jgi:outer membrane protein assembly factor BamB
MTSRRPRPARSRVQPAEIVREYGPFAGTTTRWPASPTTAAASGPPPARSWWPSIRRAASPRARSTRRHAGTAFDGKHLYQIAESRIDKIDPATGAVLASIPAPGGGSDSGLTWAEGSLWVGNYRERKIHQIDPATGAILRTIESNRFVTGVTWVDGELWHGTWEGDESELRRIDPQTGEVLERLAMPAGTGVSGLESDGAGLFYCGGGNSGKVRAVRRPKARN